jgi:two-component system cell cycle response regulator
MPRARNLQTEVDRLVLSKANPADALREIVGLLRRRTGSQAALLARWEDEERGASVLAHPSLGTQLAYKLCAALAPYRATCVRSGKPLAITSSDRVLGATLPDEVRAMKLGRLLLVPLRRARQPLGLLVLAWRSPSLGAAASRVIERVSAPLALLVEQTVYLEKISVYSNFANLDGLTGLHTHRYFQEELAKEIGRAQRIGYPVSLMMIDIDHFKQYNDTFGHPQGDVALKEIAGVLMRSIRSYDLAARYGGEELVLVLPHASPHRMLPLAERIRTAVAELPFRGATDAQRVQLTVSIGVAGLPAHAKTKSELIERADQALYMAKEEGRNRVSVALVRSRKSIRFAYCPPAFTSSYYVDILTGVRDVIEELGGIELIARAPNKESDRRRLAHICRTLIRGGIDAVALASQSDSLLPMVRDFNRARVPVFFFNAPRRLSGAQIVSYIGYRQKEAGREVGRYLARVLRARGSILVLKGLSNASSRDRVAGFMAEIARYPKMCVVATRQADWERAKARHLVERLLAKHSLDAIYAVSDEMALGASDAVTAAGRQGEIFVVGLDGTRAALQAIREGRLTATLNTNPREMGRILMRTVVRGLNRRERVEPEILSPINIVDLGNVAHH